jgi:hypothetical protein
MAVSMQAIDIRRVNLGLVKRLVAYLSHMQPEKRSKVLRTSAHTEDEDGNRPAATP